MASTMVKKVMLKIVADDGDSEEKLDKISAKADELGRKHPDIKVRIDSAAASAKLAVLRRELKDTSNDAKQGESRFGALGQALNLFATGGLSGGIGEMSMFGKVMLGLNVATGLGEPLIAGLTVAVGGLAAGVTSAGLGLGAYALVVKEAMKNNKGFKDSIKSAKDEYEKWASSLERPVVAPLERGLKLVMPLLHDMTPFVRTAADAVGQLVSRIGSGLKSSGFTSFLDSMHKIEGSSITGLGTALIHIASGFGGILKAFAPFVPVVIGGLDKITAAFARWGQTLSSHSGFQSLISMFKSETPLAVGVLKNLAGIIKTVVSEMTGMSTFSNSKMLLQLALPILKFTNALLKAHPQLVWLVLYLKLGIDGFKKMHTAVTGVSTAMGDLKKGQTALSNLKKGMTDADQAANDATGAWGTFGGKLSSVISGVKEWGIWSKIAAAATRVWTGVQAAFDAVMDANPIALVIIAIAALIAIIVICVIKFKAFRDFWVKLWHDVVHFADVAFEWVKSHFKLLAAVLLTIATGGLGLVVAAIVSHFTQIREGAMRLVGDVTSFFRSLPGRILSAVGNLGSLLLQGGENLIMGLVHGIESVAMAPVHAVEGIVGDIRSLLPFSPAKRGPLSGQGSPDIAGRKIGMMLAGGIRGSSPMVAAAATAMAGAAAVHPGSGRGGAGGEIVLRIEGSDQSLVNALVLALRRDIRIKGGNVQTVLGH